MSSIPKRSIAPGSGSNMRRSSSASGPEVFSSSQGQKSLMGRSSSSDGRASSVGLAGRASSIGGAGFRPSICNFKTSDGKTVTPADLASDILKVSICSGQGEVPFQFIHAVTF